MATSRQRIPRLLGRNRTPLTIRQISEALDLSRAATQQIINRMRKEGAQIRIHSWIETGASSIPTYLYGDDPDAPKPIEARALIPQLIASEALSIPEIAERLDVTPQTIGVLLKKIKTPIRIDSWHVGRGVHVPRYIMGEGPDAIKPAPMTNAEKAKRYRESPHGKKVCRKCRIRWRKSLAGKDYFRHKDQARSAKSKFEKHGVKAFDPLTALFYR